MTDAQKVGWVGRHDLGWNGKHYLAVKPDGTIVDGFYATEEDARAALAAAQTGAPTTEDLRKLDYRIIYDNGFAAGIEAAAIWHDEKSVECEKYKFHDRAAEHRAFAKRLRALRPPTPAGAPGEGEQ